MVRLTPEQVNQIVATNTSVGVVALELELRAVMDERDRLRDIAVPTWRKDDRDQAWMTLGSIGGSMPRRRRK